MDFRDSPVEDIPVGAILAHSLTFNGRKLGKGHRLSSEDIDAIREIEDGTVTIAILGDDDVHEDDAADRLASKLCGDCVTGAAAFTGRANLYADADGILCLNEDVIKSVNHLNEAVTVASLANHERVSRKQMLATIKIIPFAVTKDTVESSVKLASKAPISVRPFQPLQCTLLQTELPGTKAKLLDKTADVVRQRVESLGGTLKKEIRCRHNTDDVAQSVRNLQRYEPDLILISGASAVTDRRDVLPTGLEKAGGNILHFGMPVDPGNLLLLGELQSTPVIGMPGCARSPKVNGFDWVLQRIFAGAMPSRQDIMDMGVGGLLKEIQSRPQPRNSQARDPAPKRANIAALVLAAGRSSRMGEQNKLLARVEDQPMVVHLLNTLKQAQLESTFVVTGHQHKDIEAVARPFQPTFVHNPDYREGLSTSLKRGIAAIPKDIDAVLICLGDMPFISADVIARLINAYDPLEDRNICVPTYSGRRGNPVLIGRRYFAEIHEISGDKGARDLIRNYAEAVCEVPVDSDEIFVDIDTPEALASYSSK